MTVHCLSCYMNIPKYSKLFIQIVRETSFRKTSVRKVIVRETSVTRANGHHRNRCRYLSHGCYFIMQHIASHIFGTTLPNFAQEEITVLPHRQTGSNLFHKADLWHCFNRIRQVTPTAKERAIITPGRTRPSSLVLLNSDK